MRVGILENDHSARKAISMVLRHLGHDAVELDVHEANPRDCDVVIADYHLNGHDLPEVLGRIRPHAGVVCVTGADGLREAMHLVQAGVDAFLTKPFDAAELYVALENSYRRQQRERRLRLIVEAIDAATVSSRTWKMADLGKAFTDLRVLVNEDQHV